MKQIPGKLIIFFIIISLMSAFQTFIYVVRAPAGFVYPLVHNYEQDYYWYLSLMRQGWDGWMSVTTKFSFEVFPRVFVNTFFPFFGFIARITGMSLPSMYLVLRIVTGALLLFAGYFLLKKLNVERNIRITAVAFMIFGAPFWFVQNGVIHQIGEFWTGFDPILRVTWLPHHLTANVFLIVSFIALSRAVNIRSMNMAGVASICAIVGIWCNPATITSLGIAVSFGVIAFIIQKGKIRLREIVLLGVLCCIPMMAFYTISNATFPWTMFRDWERFVQYPVNAVSYLGVLGLVGVIGFFGIKTALKKRSFLWDMVVGWFLAPFIGLAITQFLPLSNGRFIQGAGYIPAAILASVFIWDITVTKKSAVKVISVIIGCILLFEIPSFYASSERQIHYVQKNMTNEFVMVPKEYWDTVVWIQLHAQKGSIIAPESVSPLLGALTSLYTFSGHPTFTFEPQKKQFELQQFYFGYTDQQRQEFIARWNPTYIWTQTWGPRIPQDTQKYDIVYQNNSVILYEHK